MELDSSLLCSQEPVIGICPEHINQIHILTLWFFKLNFN
jgi:hypothetical protein